MEPIDFAIAGIETSFSGASKHGGVHRVNKHLLSGIALFLSLPLLAAGAVASQVLREGATHPLEVEQDLEEYHPREDWFAQRAEDPGGRDWTLYPSNYPDLAETLEQPPAPHSPAGIYCWAAEYAEAHEEIARMGIRAVRLAGPWGDADAAMLAAAGHGVEVFFTLMMGSTLEQYRLGVRPSYASDAVFAQAYAAEVGAFLQRYGPGGIFERQHGVRSPLAAIGLWNEPNFQYMIPNSGDEAADEAAREALYPQLVHAAFGAARRHAPDIAVVGFSSGGADFADERFIRNIHRADPAIVAHYDILATHPYNKGAPPEARKIRSWGQYSIADGRAVIGDLYAELGAPPKPVWYTELGWAIARKHGGRFPAPPNRVRDIVTPDLQAAYVIRSWLLAPRLNVERVFIMNLHDTDGFNGGFIVRDSHEWRPVAHAARNFTGLLPAPRLLEALHDGEDGLCAYRYKADHRDPRSPSIWVLWNAGGPRAIAFPTERESVELVDMVGNTRIATPVDGMLELTVGPYPVYLR
jgi:hypothetical protein